MAGADDDSAAWAAQFAELLARQAETAVELLGLISAESPDKPSDEARAGDEEEWALAAEQLEAQWRHFVQDQTEAFVAAWPDIVRNLTSLLPLVSRSQPLLAMLAQLLPLLAGPEVLGRTIDSRGASLVKELKHFLADLSRSQVTFANSTSAADGEDAGGAAGNHSGRDQMLP